MSRIFLVGDTHGDLNLNKLLTMNFPQQQELTKDDYVIILGDVGIFFNDETLEKKLIEWYNKCNFTTLFIDGNHENFDKLNALPIIEWNGGKVHKISDSIYHLMRGQVFTIANKTFFTMGGGESIDKYRRVENETWWAAEMPTYQECELANAKLDEYHWQVDYVLTHSVGDNILYRINPYFEHDMLTNYLFSIDKELQYKHWYFGHYHQDRQYDDKHTCLFQDIIELEL